MKIDKLIDQYLAVSPQISGTQLQALRRMRKDSIGKCKVPVTPKNIIDWMRERNITVSPATAYGDLVYMRGMLEYAQIGLGIEGVTAVPIAEALPILRRQRLIAASNTRERIPSASEHAMIIAYLRGTKVKPEVIDVIDYQYKSGWRVGETCRVIWGDYDPAKRTMLVRDMKHPRKKTGHNVRLVVLDEAAEIIERQPRLTNLPDERIFKVESTAVSAVYTRACKELRIVGLHLHDSRARVVTHLQSQGYSDSQIILVTGHETTRMAKARYGRMTADDFPRRAAQ